jgi:hypothetical protein
MAAGKEDRPPGRGRAIFLAEAILEILGHNAGVALSIPGGLFEIAFGVLLIAKGFPERQSPRLRRTAPQHPCHGGTVERANTLMR